MSDYYTIFIPVNPNFRPTDEAVKAVVEYLETCVAAYSVEARVSETPEFVDCGGLLEEISCPLCGEPVLDEWWVTAMDEAFKNHFTQLEVQTPCCGRKILLNDLNYVAPCGFACVEFDLLYPREELSPEEIREVERRLQVPVKVIHSRI